MPSISRIFLDWISVYFCCVTFARLLPLSSVKITSFLLNESVFVIEMPLSPLFVISAISFYIFYKIAHFFCIEYAPC